MPYWYAQRPAPPSHWLPPAQDELNVLAAPVARLERAVGAGAAAATLATSGARPAVKRKDAMVSGGVGAGGRVGDGDRDGDGVGDRVGDFDGEKDGVIVGDRVVERDCVGVRDGDRVRVGDRVGVRVGVIGDRERDVVRVGDMVHDGVGDRVGLGVGGTHDTSVALPFPPAPLTEPAPTNVEAPAVTGYEALKNEEPPPPPAPKHEAP